MADVQEKTDRICDRPTNLVEGEFPVAREHARNDDRTMSSESFSTFPRASSDYYRTDLLATRSTPPRVFRGFLDASRPVGSMTSIDAMLTEQSVFRDNRTQA